MKLNSKFWAIFNKEKEKRARSEAEQQNLIYNGAILLEKQILSYQGKGMIMNTEPLKIFSAIEIRQATNDFDRRQIIGSDISTVYKGTLDGRTVAIKVYEGNHSHVEIVNFFLNQVTIKQLINHKNIVRLYGCCLETLVPILIYEFIANGTLFHYLHEKGNPNLNQITWIDRVRIAYEISYALSYMHCGSINKIFHLDIKSANIFLDENLTAKLTNFGFSLLVSPNSNPETLTGYTDLEYHEVLRNTDVSSFAIVLVELLTGIDPKMMPYGNLVERFALSMAEEQQKMSLIAQIVMVEGRIEDIEVFAEIVLKCAGKKGDGRPTMKEVAMEFKRLLNHVKS